MKIFLTGGTGFIGSHFLRSAFAFNHEIVALRREKSRTCLTLEVEPRWLVRSLDEVTREDLAGCSALVHLASPGVSPQQATWTELFHWNVTITLRLVDQARLAGIRRVVVAGTFAEYGRSADRFDPIPANAPLEPTTAYAASKAAAAVTLTTYAREQGMELVYLRIFSAFGEGQYEANFWPALRKAALSGADFAMTAGEQVRDYLPAEEVAKAFWRAATEIPVTAGEPIVANIGSGQPITMRAFAEKWWTHFGAKGSLKTGALPYRPNEVMRFVPLVTPL